MEALTFGEFAKYANIPRTTVYTRLNHLKKHQPDAYDKVVFQDETNMLKIHGEYVEELKQFIATNQYDRYIQQIHESGPIVESHTELTTDVDKDLALKQLNDALKRSEARYNRLFEDYIQLSEKFQEANDRLMNITEMQQSLIQEQVKAIEARDPRRLAERLQQMDTEVPARFTTDDDNEDYTFKTRAEARAEAEARVEIEARKARLRKS